MWDSQGVSDPRKKKSIGCRNKKAKLYLVVALG